MKVDKKPIIEQKTNQTNVRRIGFGIGNEPMIIEILRSRLYSNPIQVLVQEYISNARDANREAQATRPIRIVAPTIIEPVLKIRDFGPGIDPQRMATIFSQYGNSSKRNDNNMLGGFGIGAKSAWAYTDAFTLITFVDGTAYHYVAHIAENKTGLLDLISETPTDETNGTEIHVAVKTGDVHLFEAAIRRAVTYWEPVEAPEIINRSFCVDANFFARLHNVDVAPIQDLYRTYGEIKCVIDGIPYPLPAEMEWQDDARDLRESYRAEILLRFMTGEIEISANREQITTSDANKTALKIRLADALLQIQGEIKRRIVETPSLADSFAEVKKLKNIIKKEFEYQAHGVSFSTGGKIVAGKIVEGLWVKKYYYREDRYGQKTQKINQRTIPIHDFDFTQSELPVYFRDADYSQPQIARRVKKAIAGNNALYLIEGNFFADFAEFSHVFPVIGLSSVAADAKPRTRKNANQIRAKLIEKTKKKSVLINVNTTHLYFFIKERESNFESIKRLAWELDLQLIEVGESDAKKLENYPTNFVSIQRLRTNPREFLNQSQFDKIISGIGEHPEEFEIQAATVIEDQQYAELIRANANNTWNNTVLDSVPEWAELPEVRERKKLAIALCDRRKLYPLFSALATTAAEVLAHDYADYVNLMYRRRSENG